MSPKWVHPLFLTQRLLRGGSTEIFWAHLNTTFGKLTSKPCDGSSSFLQIPVKYLFLEGHQKFQVISTIYGPVTGQWIENTAKKRSSASRKRYARQASNWRLRNCLVAHDNIS